jgi:hypothetical protein
MPRFHAKPDWRDESCGDASQWPQYLGWQDPFESRKDFMPSSFVQSNSRFETLECLYGPRFQR